MWNSKTFENCIGVVALVLMLLGLRLVNVAPCPWVCKTRHWGSVLFWNVPHSIMKVNRCFNIECIFISSWYRQILSSLRGLHEFLLVCPTVPYAVMLKIHYFPCWLQSLTLLLKIHDSHEDFYFLLWEQVYCDYCCFLSIPLC